MLFSPKTYIGKTILYISITLAAAFVLIPYLWIFLTSIKDGTEVFTQPIKIFPKTFRIENFITIWKNRSFDRYFLNTIVIASFTTVLSVLLAAMAGYGFSRFKFNGKGLFQNVILITQMFPESLLIVPYFMTLSKLGLVNTHFSLIIAYISFALPFSTWMLMGFFNSLPKELDESAMVDGCGRIKAFFLIILPLAGPGISATAIFSFLLAWNNYLFALVLTTSEKMFTISIGLSTLIGEYSIAWNELAAATVMASGVVILIFSFLEKYMVQGMTAGAVKG